MWFHHAGFRTGYYRVCHGNRHRNRTYEIFEKIGLVNVNIQGCTARWVKDKRRAQAGVDGKCCLRKAIWRTFMSDRASSCRCVYRNTNISILSSCNRKASHILAGMVRRCYNPEDKNCRLYGGKGVCICNEWQYYEKAFQLWYEQQAKGAKFWRLTTSTETIATILITAAWYRRRKTPGGSQPQAHTPSFAWPWPGRQWAAYNGRST